MALENRIILYFIEERALRIYDYVQVLNDKRRGLSSCTPYTYEPTF